MEIAKMMSTTWARALRVLIGAVIAWYGFSNTEGVVMVVLIILGAVFVLSGLLNFCGLAKVLGGPFWGKDAK